MQPEIDPIRDYIAANRDRYTRETITEQLTAAGHDKASIDEAWDELDARDPVPGERPRNPRLLAYLLLAYAVGFAALVWFGGLRFENWLLAYAVAGGISVLLLMRLKVFGLRWAFVLPLVPLILGAVWYGTCMATWYLRCDGHISIYC